MLEFLNRDFNEWRGMFYDGNRENAIYTFDWDKAIKWRESNKDKMEKVSITIPPKKKISFMIPLVEDWEVDDKFYEFVYDKKTDSILSWVLEIFLKEYIPLKWWLFKKNDNVNHQKHDSINLEKFQAMKDIIMGRFRVTPIKIPVENKDNKKEVKYFDWSIGSDNYDVEYEYKWKKYKTNHFWLYASNFRRAMFADADDYDFYGWHSMQYWQRMKEFESWYVTYTNACRWLGKSISENFWQSVDLCRERVFKWERTRPYLWLYYGATKEEVNEIFQYTISMYKYLLSAAWWEKLVKKLLHHSVATGTLTLNDWDQKRRLRAVSENQSARGSRPSRVVVDEMAKFKKADEVLKEVLWFGKCPISIISTVKEDTTRNEFYDNWANAYSNMRKYEEDMFDIVHDIRWKYWFGKCEKPEDYLDLAKQWVFDKARWELFRRRNLVWLKYTIDDSEVKDDYEKDLEIQAMLDSSWYGWLMAEFYWVVLSDKTVFKASWNVVNNLPHLEWKSYQHIYFSYDEADEDDNPAVVVGWIYNWLLYVLDSVKLTADLTKRYEDMQQLYQQWRNHAIWWVTTIIADVNRWVTIRETIVKKLGKLDIPFVFTRTAAKEDFKISDWKHIVNKGWLVNLLSKEYLPKGKVMIWNNLENEWWLLEEMSDYVALWWGKYWGRKKKKDDQITALLQIIYAVHIWYFRWIREMWYDNLTKAEIRKRMVDRELANKRNKEILQNKRSVLGRYF